MAVPHRIYLLIYVPSNVVMFAVGANLKEKLLEKSDKDFMPYRKRNVKKSNVYTDTWAQTGVAFANKVPPSPLNKSPRRRIDRSQSREIKAKGLPMTAKKCNDSGTHPYTKNLHNDPKVLTRAYIFPGATIDVTSRYNEVVIKNKRLE